MRKTIQNLRRIIFWILVVVLGFGNGCVRQSDRDNEPVLAKIGDQRLTIREFQDRTELTPRPKYPALNDEETKRVYLNNLIVEKLMAKEGYQGEREQRLIQNPVFRARIKGLQEQKMREQLYMEVALENTTIDSQEIQSILPMAGREYHVSYYSIHDDSLAVKVGNALEKDSKNFNNLFREISPDQPVSQKVIKFSDPDPIAVHQAVFSRLLDIGQVIGPLKIEDNYHLVIRVDDWKYYPMVNEIDVRKRWHTVENKLIEKKANRQWNKYVADVMKGKRVEFEKAAFNQLSRIFFDVRNTNNQLFKNQILKNFLSSGEKEITFDNQIYKNINLDQPFFRINGDIWTIRDFREAYMSHPLVFRYKSTTFKHFQKDFYRAIVDMVRDYFLTKKAYQRKIDRHPDVRRTKVMWEDAYVAAYHRDCYLAARAAKKDSLDADAMNKNYRYLNLYADSLQKAYSDQIELNIEALHNIQLTEIDLIAMKPNMPYPRAVPMFPEFVHDSHLDYGSPMKSVD
ncbi:hypothetical protein JW835_16315 [bacterium]|nr:hypothetical protein [bacterium]